MGRIRIQGQLGHIVCKTLCPKYRAKWTGIIVGCFCFNNGIIGYVMIFVMWNYIKYMKWYRVWDMFSNCTKIAE
jgi:hypothetical protein